MNRNWTWEQLVARGQMLALAAAAESGKGIEHSYDAHVAVAQGVNFLRVGGTGFQIVINGLAYHHKKNKDRDYDRESITEYFAGLIAQTGLPINELVVTFPEEGITATVTVTPKR